jgi:SAM-dependent methyltransferase
LSLFVPIDQGFPLDSFITARYFEGYSDVSIPLTHQDEEAMTREQCPVCSASDLEELIVLDEYPFGGNGAVQASEADKVPTGTLSIGICRVCGSLFQLEPATVEDLDGMLLRQPGPMTMEETGMETAETDRFLESLRRYAPDGGRVLDIGCSTGTVMSKLKEWGYDVEGIDADPRAAETARERGFEVREGRFEEGIYDDESFDLIVCRSVLDHAPEPATLLASMGNILKPEGVLAVEVPNVGRVFKRGAFGGFSFHHQVYWTVPTLRYALSLEGLDLIGGYEESYIAMFGQKPGVDEEVLDPVPPSDEEVEEVFEEVNEFLDRKDRIAEELPGIIRKQFPQGITILGAGTPTVDLLYYVDLQDLVSHVVTTDKTRYDAKLAGNQLPIESMDVIERKQDYDAVLVSSERRQEELLERLDPFLDRGGRVIRFKPDIEIV